LLVSATLVTLYAGGVIAVALAARWAGRAFDRASLSTFALLPLLFVWPGVFQDRTPVPTDHVVGHVTPWKSLPGSEPHNATLSDFASQFAPWAKAVRVAWKEGSLPFRDRWNGCGTALAANGQSAAFSPLTVASFALPLARAFVFLGACRLFLAFAGAWLWLRELGVSTSSARFGAVSFGLSFALTPWLFHPAAASVCLWPWVLFALELARSDRRRAFWLTVILFAAWPLSGHLESMALGLLFAGLWIVARVLQRRLPAMAFATFGLGAAIGLGLAAFLLVPHARVVAASNRLVLARDPSHLAHVPWTPYQPGWLGGFVSSLFPRSFGDAVDSPMIPGAAGSIVEMGFGYFGIVGWALVLQVLRPGSRRRSAEKALLGLILVGWLASMEIGPFRWIVEAIPGIGLSPPLRILLFVSIAGCAAAAFELDRLQRDAAETSARRPWPFLVSACLALAAAAVVVFLRLRPLHEAAGGLASQKFALRIALAALSAAGIAAFAWRGPARRRGLAAALTVIAGAELFYQGARLYRFYPTATLYPATPLLAFLQAQPGPFRVVGTGVALYPNTNVFPGLEDVRTHDPAERRDYLELLDAAAGYPPFDYFKPLRDVNAPILDFLNVKYLIGDAGVGPPGEKWFRVYDGPDGSVWENRRVLDRLFAPATIHFVEAGPASPPRRLARFGPDFRRFLESRTSFDQAAFVLASPGDRTHDVARNNRLIRARRISESTNRAIYDVVVGGDTPALLVSSYADDGGWEVSINGSRAPALAANGPFLAVAAPPGASRIELTYTPPGFRTGLSVTVLGVVAVAVAGVAPRRRARTK
jgi:hypothetical protein